MLRNILHADKATRKFLLKMWLVVALVLAVGCVIIWSLINKWDREQELERAMTAMTATSHYATLHAPPTPTSTPVPVTFENICDFGYVSIEGRITLPIISMCFGHWCSLDLTPVEGGNYENDGRWEVHLYIHTSTDPNQIESPVSSVIVHTLDGIANEGDAVRVSGVVSKGPVVMGGWDAPEGSCNMVAETIHIP